MFYVMTKGQTTQWFMAHPKGIPLKLEADRICEMLREDFPSLTHKVFYTEEEL